MMDRREHETDAGLFDGRGDLRRLQLDGRTQCFDCIGTAGLGRHAAVAMLGHAHARAGNDKGRGG